MVIEVICGLSLSRTGLLAKQKHLCETICLACNSHLSPPWPTTLDIQPRTSLKVTSLVKRLPAHPEEGNIEDANSWKSQGSKLFIYLQIKTFSVQQQTGSRAEPFKIAQSHKVIQKGREGQATAQKLNPSEWVPLPRLGISSTKG